MQMSCTSFTGGLDGRKHAEHVHESIKEQLIRALFALTSSAQLEPAALGALFFIA
jgi:hypothetical protein